MRVFLRQQLIQLNRADFCLASMNYNRLSNKNKKTKKQNKEGKHLVDLIILTTKCIL